MPKNIGVILSLQDRFSPKIKKVAEITGKSTKEIQKASKTIVKFQNEIGKGFQTACAGIGTGVVALGGTIATLATKSGEVCDRIDDMSNKIGISRKGFQEWDYLLGQNGGQIESLQMGFKKLVGQMDGVTSGNKKAVSNFKALGVSVVDANGKLKNQEQVFNECVTALQKMPAGAKKAQLANELFGRSGAELMPLFNQTTEKLAEQRAEYKRLGLEISDNVIDAGNDLGDTLEKIKSIGSSFGAVLGAEMIPIMQSACDLLISNMPKIREVTQSALGALTGTLKFLIDHMNIIIPIASACLSSIVAFNAISGVVKVINTLQAVIKAVTVAQGIWNAMMLANPIGLIAMGIGALIGVVALLIANWDKICNAVDRAIKKMKEFLHIGKKADKGKKKNTPQIDYDVDDPDTSNEPKPPKNSSGTPFFSGGLTSVNEGGRGEIINLPSGSQIIPHDIAKQSVNKNITLDIKFNINGNLIGNRELFEQFSDMLLVKVQNKLQTV